MCQNPPEETIEHRIFLLPSVLSVGYGNSMSIIQHGKDQWHKPMFMEVFMTGAWSIWKERNNLLFNGIIPDVDSWKSRLTSDVTLLVHRSREHLHPFISEPVAAM
jgi:hypothetical protein